MFREAQASPGEARTVNRFLLLPTLLPLNPSKHQERVHYQWRWMEFTSIVQRAVTCHDGTDTEPYVTWKDYRWL